MNPTAWDGRNLTNGKPKPEAFARMVVTRKTAAHRSSRFPVARPPATTRPATMPTKLNTVWSRVYVVMLKPRIIGRTWCDAAGRTGPVPGALVPRAARGEGINVRAEFHRSQNRRSQNRARVVGTSQRPRRSARGPGKSCDRHPTG